MNCDTLIVENSEFYKHISLENGGAFYLFVNKKTIIKNTLFSENTAVLSGGAIS